MSTRRTAIAAGPSTASPDGAHGELISRRTLGYGSLAALSLLTGCGERGTAASAPPSTATPSASPTGRPGRSGRSDTELLAEALLAERSLVDQLTAQQGPAAGAVRARLRAASQVHRAHVRLLGEAADGASASPSADTDASPTPGTGTAPPSPSSDSGTPSRAVLTSLARAERRLVEQHTGAAVEASSGRFARVLAGMAAAAAQQAVLLERLARRQPAAANAETAAATGAATGTASGAAAG